MTEPVLFKVSSFIGPSLSMFLSLFLVGLALSIFFQTFAKYVGSSSLSNLKKAGAYVSASLFILVGLIVGWFPFLDVASSYSRIEIVSDRVSQNDTVLQHKAVVCWADSLTETYGECLKENKPQIRTRTEALNYYLKNRTGQKL